MLVVFAENSFEFTPENIVQFTAKNLPHYFLFKLPFFGRDRYFWEDRYFWGGRYFRASIRKAKKKIVAFGGAVTFRILW